MSFDYSTFLIYLGVILMCIGFWYILYGKFAEQDHKIETMCELVSTMAQDLQMIKMQNAVDKIQHTLNMNAATSTQSAVVPSTEHINIDISENNTCYSGSNTCSIQPFVSSSSVNKIVVSDDDDTEFDTDEENEDIEDIKEDDSTRSDELSVYDDEVDEDIREIEQINDNCSEISIDEELGEVETKHIEVDLSLDNDFETHSEQTHKNTETQHIVVNKLQTRASPSPEPFVLEEDPKLIVEESLPEPELFIPVVEQIPHDHEHQHEHHHEHVKNSEHISNEDVDISNGDYSRLNVSQLRKLVTDRGLSTHATKLKKTELLSLLSPSVKTDVLHNDNGIIEVSM